MNILKRTRILFLFQALIMYLSSLNAFPKQLTILHTNDVHSHFDSDKSPLSLGGIARHKTIFDKIKNEVPNTILVDGGDWSEGSIFYQYQSGTASYQMLDHLGYDVAVLGNHDWINGPDTLLDILNSLPDSKRSPKIISANIVSKNYSREEEIQQKIKPYVILEKEGLRIAFIGLSTYEFVYDKYFNPIRIVNPFRITHKLASYLKKNGLADIVIAVSHNSVLMNRLILSYAPDVDLVIGGHDHRKLIEPIQVTKWPWRSQPGWIVEAGRWGEYVGKIDLEISDDRKVTLRNYELIQVDSTIPENEETLVIIQKLKQSLEDQYHRPVFDSQYKLAESKIYVDRNGLENYMGNLVTDAYLSQTNADFAIESYKFIYGELYPGSITEADIINAHPAVYDPIHKRSWTLKIAYLSGQTIQRFFQMMYATDQLSSYGLVSVSGLSLIYNPWFHMEQFSIFDVSKAAKGFLNLFKTSSFSGVEKLQIQGIPLNPHKVYRVATSDGFLEGIEFVKSKLLFDSMNIHKIDDTNLENWIVLKNYIQQHSPLDQDVIKIGNRIVTDRSDLGIHTNDINLNLITKTKGEKYEATINLRVKNYGNTPSTENINTVGPHLLILQNKNGFSYNKYADYFELSSPIPIRSLQPGESEHFSMQITFESLSDLIPITVRIEGVQSEVNHTNDEATRIFKISDLLK